MYKLVSFVEQNQDKLNWYRLSQNPNAIHLLEKNQDKINWHWLSRNPNAIHLLEKNQDKINWDHLSQNDSLFEYDYNAMKNNMYNPDTGLLEGLMANRFHPRNIDKFEGWGFKHTGKEYAEDEYYYE